MSSKNEGKSQISEKVPLCPKMTSIGGKSGSEAEQIDAEAVNDMSDQELYDFMAFHTGTQAANFGPDRCPGSPIRRRRAGPRLESLAFVVVTIIALLAVLFWWFNDCNKAIQMYLP